MILYLLIIQEPTDAFLKDQTAELKAVFPDKEVVSLDNFSEKWLVKNIIDHIKGQPPSLIVIEREGEVDFGSIQPVINTLPQLKNLKIVYKGKPNPLIEKLNSLKSTSIKILKENELLVPATVAYAKD